MALQQRTLVLAAWLAASAGLATAQTSTGTGTDTGAVGTRPTQAEPPLTRSGSPRDDAITACAGIVNDNVRLDCIRRQELLPTTPPGNLSPSATDRSLTPGANTPGSTDMSPGATSPGMPATSPGVVQGGSSAPAGGTR